MAAIVADDGLDLAGLRRYLVERLPPYARPVFLRVRRDMELTTTFKHTKNALVREGYNPALVKDALYFNDAKGNAFTPLGRALHDAIRFGQVRP
jgi:fatty-acyl-CoA synthase